MVRGPDDDANRLGLVSSLDNISNDSLHSLIPAGAAPTPCHHSRIGYRLQELERTENADASRYGRALQERV